MRLLLAFEAGERAGVVKDFYVTVVMNELTSILLRFDFISEVKGIDSRHTHYATASEIHAISRVLCLLNRPLTHISSSRSFVTYINLSLIT